MLGVLAPLRSRSCAFRRRASFLGWRGFLCRLRGHPHDQPVRQAHVDRLHVALENGLVALQSGQDRPRRRRHPPPAAARRSHCRAAGSSAARRHRTAAVTRAASAGSLASIAEQFGRVRRGVLADHHRQLRKAVEPGDRDHRAARGRSVRSCRRAATAPSARARPGGHRSCRAGAARSTPSGPRAELSSCCLARAGSTARIGVPRGRRARRGSSRGRSWRAPRRGCRRPRNPSAALASIRRCAALCATDRVQAARGATSAVAAGAGGEHDRDAAPRRRRGAACSPAPRAPHRYRLGRGVHESHAAFSTIQRTSSSKPMPACRAMSGTSEVGVMPGWVLTSSRYDPSVAARRCRRSADRRG